LGRYVGTGTDPTGRYVEGVIVDAEEDDDIAGPLEKGWVEALDPEDDPARSEWALADAAIRGDLQSVPTRGDDLAVAKGYRLVDDEGRPTPRAREVADADGAAPTRRRKAGG
jgi:hypothetical protein